ncbi:MAG: hypothetical protein WC284_17720 [Candidimonas sp.]
MTDRFDETIRRIERLKDLHGRLTERPVRVMDVKAVDVNHTKDEIDTEKAKTGEELDEYRRRLESWKAIPDNRAYLDAFDNLFAFMEYHFNPPTDKDADDIAFFVNNSGDVLLTRQCEAFPVGVMRFLLNSLKLTLDSSSVGWKRFSHRYADVIHDMWKHTQ